MKSYWLTLLLTSLTAGTTSPSSQAGDWPEFRGPTGQGVAKASDVPVEWSETQNVAWKRAIPGLGWSSPVIAQDRIFLTTAVPREDGDQQGHSLRTLCLQADTGDVMWDVEAFDQPPGPRVEKHDKNSHASATPVVDGDRIYVHFGPHGTACLQVESGEILWKNQELIYAPNHGTGGSPAIAGEKLVICCDGRDVQFVVGLDKRSGEIVWKTERGLNPSHGFSFCTPLILEVGERQQAICPASGAVVAYDPETGQELWRVRYREGYSVVPRPVAGAGLVYVCSGFGDERLLAIDPSGSGDVTETHVKWTLERGAPKNASPLLVNNALYIVDDNGVASCLDPQTGKRHWQKRLGGNFSASPTYAGGHVYFQNEKGVATVIRASTIYEELAKNQLASTERTFASYAVDDSALVIRNEGHLYRIEDEPQP